jgi:ribosomal protein S18 acetylase RimI-like enzyme
MKNFKIVYVDQISEATQTKMEAGFKEYEDSHGIQVNYKPFALVIKDDQGAFIGILQAYTAFAEIYIHELWVDDQYRHQGYGRQLMQELEYRYRDHGLNNINTVSCEFQAPDFYKKCGYSLEYVRKNTINPKLNLYFFVKFFDDINKTKTSADRGNIEYIDEITDELTKSLEVGLTKHEVKHGIDVNYKAFALILMDDHKDVIGVLRAFHSYSSIYIDDIWVDSRYRHKGYGRQLIQKVENLFKGQGFDNINLVTSEFQAPEFYKKCGFTLEFVRKNNQNAKFNKYIFVKFFEHE